MPETPPVTQVRTKAQLLSDFFGGQEPLLKIRNLIETMFDGATQVAITWLTSDGTALRSTRDRLSEVVNVRDLGAVPSNASSNFNTVFDAGIAALQARTGIDKRMVLYIPPGRYRAAAAFSPIHNFITGNPLPRLHIMGAGSNATEILTASGLADIFTIGQHSGTLASTRTGNITFSGFTVTPGDAHTGAIFRQDWCSDVTYRDILINGGKHGWSLGEHHTDITEDNDCVFTRITGCGGTLQASLGGDMFRLNSGGVLEVNAGGQRWGGNYVQGVTNGNTLVRVTGTGNHSWDGLYLHNLFCEQFNHYLTTDGRGIGNIEWHGGQMDRGSGAIAMTLQENATIRGMLITGVSIRGIIGIAVEIDASLGTSYAILHVCNNEVYGTDEEFVKVAGATQGTVGLNTVRNPGRTGTPFISIGDGSDLWVRNNLVFEDPAIPPATGYTDGIAFAGATTGRRGHNDNTFLDLSGSATTGTP